jgi:uncharacterized membrane protein
MNHLTKGAALAAALFVCAPVTNAAMAQTPAQQSGAQGGAVTGVVGGAVVGAVVGGPIGAVIGGVIGGASGATVGALTADDRVYVQQYVYSRQVEPVMIQQPIAVGQPVPAGVTVHTFEGNPRLATYRYAYINQQYVLIDNNGRVMGAIER